MAKFSTHVLSSLDGTHLSDILVSLYRISTSGEGILEFQGHTDSSGRLSGTFDVSKGSSPAEYELCFDFLNIFDKELPQIAEKSSKVSSLRLRLLFNEIDGSYHIPVILSPYGGSFWVSN